MDTKLPLSSCTNQPIVVAMVILQHFSDSIFDYLLKIRISCERIEPLTVGGDKHTESTEVIYSSHNSIHSGYGQYRRGVIWQRLKTRIKGEIVDTNQEREGTRARNVPTGQRFLMEKSIQSKSHSVIYGGW